MKINKIALVTGGGRGLGLEVTRKLAGSGYIVFMGVRDVLKATAIWNQMAEKDAVRIVHPDMENPSTFHSTYNP